jgi:hypothetical protein
MVLGGLLLEHAFLISPFVDISDEIPEWTIMPTLIRHALFLYDAFFDIVEH